MLVGYLYIRDHCWASPHFPSITWSYKIEQRVDEVCLDIFSLERPPPDHGGLNIYIQPTNNFKDIITQTTITMLVLPVGFLWYPGHLQLVVPVSGRVLDGFEDSTKLSNPFPHPHVVQIKPFQLSLGSLSHKTNHPTNDSHMKHTWEPFPATQARNLGREEWESQKFKRSKTGGSPRKALHKTRSGPPSPHRSTLSLKTPQKGGGSRGWWSSGGRWPLSWPKSFQHKNEVKTLYFNLSPLEEFYDHKSLGNFHTHLSLFESPNQNVNKLTSYIKSEYRRLRKSNQKESLHETCLPSALNPVTAIPACESTVYIRLFDPGTSIGDIEIFSIANKIPSEHRIPITVLNKNAKN